MDPQQSLNIQKNVAELLVHCTPGEQAIVSMLTLLLAQMNAIGEVIVGVEEKTNMARIAEATEKLAKQFNEVSAAGRTLLTESA